MLLHIEAKLLSLGQESHHFIALIQREEKGEGKEDDEEEKQEETTTDKEFVESSSSSSLSLSDEVGSTYDKKSKSHTAEERKASTADVTSSTPVTEASASGHSVDEDSQDKQDAKPARVSKVPTKNVHAMNVLNRVKNKLEGKDGNFLNKEAGKLSVEVQVEWIIQEAMSVENLCTLYEGWTSWI